jgi:GNAT superfamily N-acetyltransferase
MPKNAETDAEINACFDVMSELRPHLKRDTFLATIRSMQADGYRLAFISENNKPVAAAGYRILSNLHYGKYLYVDDLVTAADTRSTGQGKAMLAWLTDLALAENCAVIHLDSGTQRAEAHKFYFREGFNIASYHFARLLG